MNHGNLPSMVSPGARSISLLALFVLACGHDGATTPVASPRPAGLLAYVASGCEIGESMVRAHYELRLQRGDKVLPPIVRGATDLPRNTPLPPDTGLIGGNNLDDACEIARRARTGPSHVVVFPIQYLAVSPDSRRVAFQFDTFSGLWGDGPLGEGDGIYLYEVASGQITRLTDPSCIPPFDGFRAVRQAGFEFSPDGNRLVFVDRVICDRPDNWVVKTVDVRTAEVSPLTRLDPHPPTPLGGAGTCCARFVDNDTVSFLSTSASDPATDSQLSLFRQRLDESVPTLVAIEVSTGLARAVSIPDTFLITSGRPITVSLENPLPPFNPDPGYSCPFFEQLFGTSPQFSFSNEIIAVNDDRFLQLTDLGSPWTTNGLVSNDGLRVYFTSDAGLENPSHGCQLFTVDTLATPGSLRPLTKFGNDTSSAIEISGNRCAPGSPTSEDIPGCGGCGVGNISEDTATGSILFYSNCTESGEPTVGEIYAIGALGGEIQRMSKTSGVTANGIEVAGPYAYATLRRPIETSVLAAQ